MGILSFIVGVLILFIVLKILALPMKIIIKLVINAFVGIIVIYGLNLLGVRNGTKLDNSTYYRFFRSTRSNNSSHITIYSTRNLV